MKNINASALVYASMVYAKAKCEEYARISVCNKLRKASRGGTASESSASSG